MAISEQWAELLEPGLRMIFEQQRDALAAASRIPMLFNIQSSSKAQEHDLLDGGLDSWKEYNGNLNFDDDEQGFKTTYTHKQFTKAMKIERALVDDDLYNIINKRPKKLATTAMLTREEHAASVFNNAFSSSYVGGDSVALCGSHPYSPSNSNTQSNSGTTALSYDAVVATRKLMRAFTDDRGKLISTNPRLILVPPELEDTANDIVRTISGRPETADNSNNFLRDVGIDYLVWDYLTDANNWFMLDPMLADEYLNWFQRVPVEIAFDPTSDYSLELRFRGYMRYSYGWSHWPFVYGHNVT